MTKNAKPHIQCPVVAIGASAGGLEALISFFRATPVHAGCAFLVLTHRHADSPSMLPELLAAHTEMTVIEAAEGMQIKPDHVYVNPSTATFMALNRDRLVLLSAEQATQAHLEMQSGAGPLRLYHPIDFLFRQLALSLQDDAVAIILSGSGSDGTLGIKAIKEANGMVMVQSPATAQFTGMPISAINTEMVDFMLPPDQLSPKLLEYLNTRNLLRSQDNTEQKSLPVWAMQEVCSLLRARTGHDFSLYKSNTLRRRIERRMSINHLTNPASYIQHLQESEVECDLLFKDLLIRVTSFFRDPEIWKICLETTFPALLAGKSENQPVRVWVPGCATGEEAYTIAILLTECMQALNRHFDIKVFATDLDPGAIEIARKGEFPSGVVADIPEPYLKRYFNIRDSNYQIRKDIREMMVFASQNVIKDPPFTRLNIISCRNLLIYMNTELQRHLISLFHYALQEGGALLLGPSESIGEHAALFKVIDKKWKIFQKGDYSLTKGLPQFDYPQQNIGAPVRRQLTIDAPGRSSSPTFTSNVMKLLAQRFAPVAVVTNEIGDIYYIHGKTGLFLEPAEGRPRYNVLDMAKDGLHMPLSVMLRQAGTSNEDVISKSVRMKSDPPWVAEISVERIQLMEALRGLFLFTFRNVDPAVKEKKKAVRHKNVAGVELDKVTQLENDLEIARESYQSITDELETANEELKSTNEELQSTNEELQSTNEELETSKEEMQSLYEELSTVNAELHSKVDVLSTANDDMQNLMNSTNIAIIFLDEQLHVKRFTEQARKLIALRNTDIGRPISELTSTLVYDNLVEDASTVLSTLNEKEFEVRTVDGGTYLLRIIPYRTVENVIKGLALSFVDLKKMKQALKMAELYRAIFGALEQPSLILDSHLNIQASNAAFDSLFQTGDTRQQDETAVLPACLQASGGFMSFLARMKNPEALPSGIQVDVALPGQGINTITVDARWLASTDDNRWLLLQMTSMAVGQNEKI